MASAFSLTGLFEISVPEGFSKVLYDFKVKIGNQTFNFSKPILTHLGPNLSTDYLGRTPISFRDYGTAG